MLCTQMCEGSWWCGRSGSSLTHGQSNRPYNLVFSNELSPIYTYKNRATTKPGVIESEHAIVYSLPHSPVSVAGEGGQLKPPIPVIMASGVPRLSTTSRIYFGIVHSIQYNINVKEIGRVPETHLTILINNWRLIEDTFSYSPPSIGEHTKGTKRKRVGQSGNQRDTPSIDSLRNSRVPSPQMGSPSNVVPMLSRIASGREPGV